MMTVATAKQCDLIASLMRQKDCNGVQQKAALAVLHKKVTTDNGALDKASASRVITLLLTFPDKPGTNAAPGYYVRDGVVFVVVENKAKTHTYAKRMVVTNGRGRWEYAPGVGRNIASEGLKRLTVKEAARLGHLHGACMICGRTLTDADSVQRGIGPVCASKIA